MNEAKSYINDLDVAVRAADSALAKGDLKTVHDQSVRMNQLRQAGEKFGTSVTDRPFGNCFAAGVFAQSWWQSKLTAARRGSEAVPGSISGAWKDYQAQRSECLNAAKDGQKPLDTEQIASTSETPPRKGCLKVLGVRQDGQVGTVAYTCPKK
ncbi:hypothetical protein [Burkholderia cepacia]|uniref:hypothetical protein n=1 Tax=Burkholderia cepacia TaxID=292 RepID=UPI0026E021BC|nr:hypothetical protein [Burkholderia cepacia]MDO5940621.1 hypothetical protein [Burkholderia cepacia]